MARRNPSFLDALAHAPWPIGLVDGAAVLVVAQVLPAVLGSLRNPYLSALGVQLAGGALKPLFWVLAGVCWLAALMSLFGRKQRQQLLEAQSGLDTLRAMRWSELELLVSEAYRRQGYQVQETGHGGADGGIDLILRRDGRVSLVQCKNWRARRVGAPVEREQFGLLMHHQAAAVIIVTTGDFTPEEGLRRRKTHRLDGGPGLVGVGAERAAPGNPRSPDEGDLREAKAGGPARTHMPDLRLADGQTHRMADQGGLLWLLQIPCVSRNAVDLMSTKAGVRLV